MNHENVRRKYKSPIDGYVGSRVRDRRMHLDMSQEKLGKFLGLSFQQIQKYEKGTNRIGAGLLPHVAKALGVAITYFYEGIEPGLPNAKPRCPEEETARLVMKFISSTEGAHLIRTFMKIKDAKVRKRMLNLVNSFVQEGSVELDLERGS
jgi:transcriptional regulator with XRE-family HTH domain